RVDLFHGIRERKGFLQVTGNNQCLLMTMSVRQDTKALMHGHCHEKALIGSRYLKEALTLAYTVEEIDSGCCGMAGSFGYEKEHYDISIAIGRRRLFPAVENNPAAIVVAPGISCRQQVEHATGRTALHPA